MCLPFRHNWEKVKESHIWQEGEMSGTKKLMYIELKCKKCGKHKVQKFNWGHKNLEESD